jgi:putative transposase
MRKSRFTEEQISDATSYRWSSRYGEMEVADARRLRTPEDENRNLKKLPTESLLDVTLKEMLERNFQCPAETCCDLGDRR